MSSDFGPGTSVAERIRGAAGRLGVGHSLSGGAVGLVLVILVAIGLSGDPYYTHVLILTMFAVVLAVSYRLLLITREASFCHGTFYMLGAYTTALLTTDLSWPFWPTVLAGGIVASLVAFVIGLPSLRTSGPYFFLITFGVLIVVNSIAQDASGLTGGFSGIAGIPQPEGIQDISGFFFITLGLVVVSVALFALFNRSRWGLELVALGDSRNLAQATGTSRLANMIMALGVGAFFAGMTGSFYASYISFVSPGSFSVSVSIFIVMYVVVGGARYLVGAIVGAALLSLAPLALNWSATYEGLFTTALTLGIILVAPRGVVVELVERVRSFINARVGRHSSALAPKGPLAFVGRVPVQTHQAVHKPRSRESTKSEDLLRITDLSRSFGGVQALDRVSFTVRPREVVGLIGPNGAGKTTLFNCISGFAMPTSGLVAFEGDSIVGMPPHKIARLGLTRTFQASVVFERLTVHENLLVAARSGGWNPLRSALVPVRSRRVETSRADEMVEAFGLQQWAHADASSIPYGVRKVLGVAIGMAARPRLLCLDEPMAGLTASEGEQMQQLLNSLGTGHDTALLLIEHRMPVVMSLCARIVVLNFGRVIVDGTPEEVRLDPQVIEAYLGREAVQ